MAKKVISYKLNENGTIPDFVDDGGYLAKDANDTPNMVVLGISKDGADISGAEAEFADEVMLTSGSMNKHHKEDEMGMMMKTRKILLS